MNYTPNYIYNARVLNIVDGDTLDLEIDMGFRCKSTHRVRLLRINTCELNSNDPFERQRALDAKTFVTSAVLGKSVTIQTVKSDSFGRYLADIWYEGKNLNQMLLDTGLAVVYVRG